MGALGDAGAAGAGATPFIGLFRAREGLGEPHGGELLADALGPGGLTDARIREILAGLLARTLLDVVPAPPRPGTVAVPYLVDFQVRLATLTRAVRQRADARVLRGVLALEQGEVDEAEAAFRQALSLWQRGADFNGRPAAQGYLARIEAARR